MIMTSVLKGNGDVDENPARCCEQDDESLLEEAPRRGRRIAVWAFDERIGQVM
jgi:hypothetical protein